MGAGAAQKPQHLTQPPCPAPSQTRQVRESLRGATIDVKVSEHPLQAQVEAQQAALADLRRRLPSLQGRDRGLGHRDASRLRSDIKALRAELMSQVGGLLGLNWRLEPPVAALCQGHRRVQLRPWRCRHAAALWHRPAGAA
jgi:hypothetical protein